MRVDGQCHCGAVRFEADINPQNVTICHCTDCQRMSGSAYRANVPVGAANFRLTQGSVRRYIKIAESGAKRVHGFCENCGCHFYSTNEGDPIGYSLRIGVINDRERLDVKVARRIWAKSALPWSLDISSAPARDAQ